MRGNSPQGSLAHDCVDGPTAWADAPVDEVWPGMEPAMTAAKDRLFRLARAIESDVIPRLVQAHRASETLLPVAPKPTEADVQEIRAWIERYCATLTAGDFDGYRDFWTEDVVWLFRPDARSSRDAAVLANTAASQ